MSVHGVDSPSRTLANQRPSRHQGRAAVSWHAAASSARPSTDSVAHGNHSLARPSRSSRSSERPVGVPGAASSMRISPPGASSPATRRSSRSGSPPIPMLPSSSRALCQEPAPASSSKIEATTARARPRVASDADGDGGEVDADREHPLVGEGVEMTAGSAADVEHRSPQAGERELVRGVRGSEPAGAGERAADAVRVRTRVGRGRRRAGCRRRCRAGTGSQRRQRAGEAETGGRARRRPGRRRTCRRRAAAAGRAP